jgi:hypothetical protein
MQLHRVHLERLGQQLRLAGAPHLPMQRVLLPAAPLHPLLLSAQPANLRMICTWKEDLGAYRWAQQAMKRACAALQTAAQASGGAASSCRLRSAPGSRRLTAMSRTCAPQCLAACSRASARPRRPLGQAAALPQSSSSMSSSTTCESMRIHRSACWARWCGTDRGNGKAQ